MAGDMISLLVGILCGVVAIQVFNIPNRPTYITIIAWLNLIFSAANFALLLV
jgi:hypothetical protein